MNCFIGVHFSKSICQTKGMGINILCGDFYDLCGSGIEITIFLWNPITFRWFKSSCSKMIDGEKAKYQFKFIYK
jgi:hypothetical protein